MIVGDGIVSAWNGSDWREVGRIHGGEFVFAGGDESHGMTIDELLDDIDSVLADHKDAQ